MTKKEQLRKMNVIRSHLHEIYTEEINKVALSANDDKRIILEDGIHTLAYGHYKCPMGFLKKPTDITSVVNYNSISLRGIRRI